MSDIVARLHAMIDANYGDVAADSVYGSAMSDAADEIARLRAALRGVLWMAEEWYGHGGNEDTLADDYKPALAEARAALGGDGGGMA